MMERRGNFLRPPSPDAADAATAGRSITFPAGDTGHTNLTSSSGSSSSSSVTGEPLDLLSQIHAACKRQKPHGPTQFKPPRATRVLLPRGEGPAKAGTSPSVTSEGIAMQKPRGVLKASRLHKVSPDKKNVNSTAGVLASNQNDMLTGRSMLSTITDTHIQNAGQNDQQKNEMDQAAHNQGGKQYASPMQMPDQKGFEEACNQNHGEPMTRCSVVGSSVTAVSLYSGQNTRVPQSNQYASPMQMPECTVESSAVIPGSVPPKQQGAAMPSNIGDWNPENQQVPNQANYAADKAAPGNGDCLPSQDQGLSANEQSMPARDGGASQANRDQKERRKKGYDSEHCFKVNGKLYQKLGKIGSGGSSEVHKVISKECAIYALKKIKLRGRDYPTAYGFCQEIEYLNKLKGKSNIIQLIDYEVTDKKILKEGSHSPLDGRIKDDSHIYMVLEFGEIDLAHMVAQKWKERKHSNMKIDENWLRFYWQQMLEAVNTIHEERIVHSDLKPANFMLVRGSLKLIDFGIAKAIMNDTTNIQRDSQVGTLNYMSPEALLCNEQDSGGNIIKCGRPSDIWSLGCILYQMVYGKTPFADYTTFWAKFKAVTDRNHTISYEPVDNPWLIDLMQRCLAWDRDERWRIPQLLQHPFLVPLVPGDLPHIDRDPLMEKARAHGAHPEVSRLCSELSRLRSEVSRVRSELAEALEADKIAADHR